MVYTNLYAARRMFSNESLSKQALAVINAGFMMVTNAVNQIVQDVRATRIVLPVCHNGLGRLTAMLNDHGLGHPLVSRLVS